MESNVEFIISSIFSWVVFIAGLTKITFLTNRPNIKTPLLLHILFFACYMSLLISNLKIAPLLCFLILATAYLKLRFQNTWLDCFYISANYYILFFFATKLLSDIKAYLILRFSLTLKLTTLYEIFAFAFLYILFLKAFIPILNFDPSKICKNDKVMICFFNMLSLFSILEGHYIFIKIGGLIEILCLIKVIFIRISHQKEKIKDLSNQNKILINKQECLIKQNQLTCYHTYQKMYHNLYKIHNYYKTLIHECEIMSNYYELTNDTKKYIDEIKQSEIMTRSMFHTGLDVLDILFEEKLIDAKKKGINLKIIGNLCDASVLEPISLTLIFDNLINVILDTTENIKIKNKSIVVYFNQKNNENLFISIKPFIGKVYRY